MPCNKYTEKFKVYCFNIPVTYRLILNVFV